MMTDLHRALLALMLLQYAASAASNIIPLTTCNTKGVVVEGETTYLTCDYAHDLNRDKTDFYVYRAHNESSEPVIITICKWEGSSWNCETDESYTVRTEDISSQVTIEIPSAKPSLSGTYYCKTLPPDKTANYRGCGLTVTSEPQITCETSGTVREGESAHLTCDYHLDLNKNRQDFYIYRYQSNDTEPDVITLCSWDGDTINCETDKDYVMSTAITGSQVTLDIKSAHHVHSGKYVCKTLPTERLQHASHCSLTVQSADKMGSAFELAATSPAWNILVGCGVGVLLALALVVMARTLVSISQRRSCRYSVLREDINKQVFVVQGKIPYYRIDTESQNLA